MEQDTGGVAEAATQTRGAGPEAAPGPRAGPACLPSPHTPVSGPGDIPAWRTGYTQEQSTGACTRVEGKGVPQQPCLKGMKTTHTGKGKAERRGHACVSKWRDASLNTSVLKPGSQTTGHLVTSNIISNSRNHTS